MGEESHEVDYEDMEILAIIPARGGSKGIPRKNVRLLAGKPLIAHTIEHAHQARSVDRVIVSTDNSEIAAVSEQYGAEVIRRPAEISGDMASSESALLHALEFLQQTKGYEPDLVVFLQCTSPLMASEDIDGTVQALLDEDADSALAVAPFHYFLWRQDKKGEVVAINHNKNVRLQRQEREPQFLETGAVYVVRTEGFKRARRRFFGKTAMCVMPLERCLEIDELVDFRVAEVLLRERQREQQLTSLPEPIGGLVLDFDGVFTDNKVITFQDGQEAVVCDRRDGWGLAQLKKLGVVILVLSSEENPVVQARCDKLGIACLHGIQDKLVALRDWMRSTKIDASQVVYVGNDVNDLLCMQAVECGVAVSDAHPQVKAVSQIVLSESGARGAIREVADLIMHKLKERENGKNG